MPLPPPVMIASLFFIDCLFYSGQGWRFNFKIQSCFEIKKWKLPISGLLNLI